MSDKIKVELGDVPKTLFLPLWGRACESRKADPLLVDKKALEILDRVDFNFSAVAGNISELSKAGWIMRSICTDRVVTRFLEKHPQAAVVNIGCGLDTTFDRIDNGQLHWFDLDLPDVIALRRKFIPESGRRKFLSASFLEEGWRKEIQPAENVLFVAAGVFYYFREEEIRNFFQTLADEFPGGEMLFDACSPIGVKTANRMVVRRAGMDERSFLRWELNRTEDILSWDPRFRILNTIFYFGEKRLPLGTRMMGLVSDLLKAQYMIHLGLGKKGE
ncbi:MAG: class I SAM-dependent methyltransferase [Anaerolineales bacterium]|nr:class I SAM-dependent methyltransferase [Anaerolineales bacterium]